MTRTLREHAKEVLALVALVAIGLTSLTVILANQRFTAPGWVPLIGAEHFELKGEFTSSQAVTPGQGQSVEIAGVRVGELTEVHLVNGHAVVTMNVEDKYVKLIHPDASMLLRPKTGLNDMVIELDPGVAAGQMDKGATVPLASTQTPVNPDEILATLDADTRGFLNLLLQGGAKGLGGHGTQLSSTLRRLEPTSRDLAAIGNQLALRRENISRAVHSFRSIAGELGNNDAALTEFIDSSNGVLGSFAKQERSIRGALQRLPGALTETHAALTSAGDFAEVAKPALTRLLPGAKALAPALRRTRPFFQQTTAPVRDQIRPFTTQVREPVIHTKEAAIGLGSSIPPLNTAFSHLNTGLNALAYNPSGQQEGFLFYLPWLNHNTNSLFLTQDAHGPLRRGIVMLSCSTAQVAEQIVVIRPLLKTVLEASGTPTSAEIC